MSILRCPSGFSKSHMTLETIGRMAYSAGSRMAQDAVLRPYNRVYRSQGLSGRHGGADSQRCFGKEPGYSYLSQGEEMSRILVVVCITLLVGSALLGCTAAQANGR